MDARSTVSVPGSQSGVRSAAEAAARFSARHRLPDPLRRKVLTALDEVLSNIVRHGFQGQPGSITVIMTRLADRIVVEVADPGEAFDPLVAAAPDTQAPLDARPIGGLGIALVRGLTDDLQYERRDGRNQLTLIWLYPGHAEEERDAD